MITLKKEVQSRGAAVLESQRLRRLRYDVTLFGATLFLHLDAMADQATAFINMNGWRIVS